MTARKGLSREAGPLNYPAVPLDYASKGYVDDFYVPASRLISAGTGLTGGGNLTVDQTLAVTYGTTAGTVCQGNDVRLAPLGTSVTVTATQFAQSSTTSTTFVDLPTTVAVSYVVPPSGKVLVMWSADLWGSTNNHSYLDYRSTGTNTRLAQIATAARVFGTNGVRSTGINLMTGLTVGATNTLTLQAATDNGPSTAFCGDKVLIVQPVI